MKVLIATPTMGTVTTRYFMSMLSLRRPCQCSFSVEDGSLVYMARNRLALKAINGDFDYILWIDSDMEIPADAMELLIEDAVNKDLEFVSGLYFKRCFPTAPVICNELQYKVVDGCHVSTPVIYSDYPKNDVFEIAAAGFGCCLIKVDAVKAVAEHFKCSPFEPMPGMGEDFAFCKRMADMGKKMYCDSRIKAGHVGNLVFNETLYEGQSVEE